jgi:hypothetical protein
MERRSRYPARCLRPGAAARGTPRAAPSNSHICAKGENEVVIVDVWETEEDLRSMQENPEFLRNLEAAGFPSDPTETIYQVHATIP